MFSETFRRYHGIMRAMLDLIGTFFCAIATLTVGLTRR